MTNVMSRAIDSGIKAVSEATYNRGDIVWVKASETTCGSEQSGIRPAVIIQNDMGNKYSPTVIIGYMTTKNKKCMPTHVGVDSRDSGLPEFSTVLLEQINTIDKKRIIKKAGQIPESMVQSINKALMISLALN